jgi:hypothetical protein
MQLLIKKKKKSGMNSRGLEKVNQLLLSYKFFNFYHD